ncbi:ankyrin repeat-containing domain protein [Russula aff. rugulosa BPL654]|nr:ankyrin repeat-containing domain protein [Russula aff. rugulosa BPL654]
MATPLICASEQGYLDIVHLLLANGARAHCRNNVGWTPLMLASRDGHTDVVRMLLQNGANGNPNDSLSPSSDSSPVYQEFGTPLHLASTDGHLAVVELLIQCGADVNMPNQNQETPLDLASAMGILRSCVYSSHPARV